MQISKGIYSNTDKFINGNKTKFFYSGKLYEEYSDKEIFFCYSYSKPKKNQIEGIHRIQMENSQVGYQVNMFLENLGNMYFSFESDGKKDNNRGHWYKVVIEEMPLALLVLKQQALPQKVSKFDFLKDRLKSSFARALDSFSKLRAINSYNKKEVEEK